MMAEYLRPDVFVESVNSANAPIEAISASTGGFVGVTARGILNTAVLVTSWQSFLDNFAKGLETPFLANSFLAHSVYGFFQNGGTKCYVVRVAGDNAAKATGVLVVPPVEPGGESTTTSVAISAKDEGLWGNNLKVKFTISGAKCDVKITLGESEVEVYKDLSLSAGDDYYKDVINNNSGYIVIGDAFTNPSETVEYTFTGGNDGIADITDAKYLAGLQLFDPVDDVNLICIPGETSTAIITGLFSYAENRGDVFAIADCPMDISVTDAVTLRSQLSCKNGALYYPWIKVTNPLSKTNSLVACPSCGHVMGVYARTIQERGIWKAPAGVECVIRGAVEVTQLVSKTESETLNIANINALVPKPNYGIVVWGARSLHPLSNMKYVSDVLLNTNIKKSIYEGTQWAVFEPNDSVLWTKLITSIESFLDGLWRDGGLKGAEAAQAYFVKCDEENNPQSSIDAGKVNVEVGYAPNKPAEFVIIKIAHGISGN